MGENWQFRSVKNSFFPRIQNSHLRPHLMEEAIRLVITMLELCMEVVSLPPHIQLKESLRLPISIYWSHGVIVGIHGVAMCPIEVLKEMSISRRGVLVGCFVS